MHCLQSHLQFTGISARRISCPYINFKGLISHFVGTLSSPIIPVCLPSETFPPLPAFTFCFTLSFSLCSDRDICWSVLVPTSFINPADKCEAVLGSVPPPRETCQPFFFPKGFAANDGPLPTPCIVVESSALGVPGDVPSSGGDAVKVLECDWVSCWAPSLFPKAALSRFPSSSASWLFGSAWIHKFGQIPEEIQCDILQTSLAKASTNRASYALLQHTCKNRNKRTHTKKERSKLIPDKMDPSQWNTHVGISRYN